MRCPMVCCKNDGNRRDDARRKSALHAWIWVCILAEAVALLLSTSRVTTQMRCVTVL